MARIPKGSWLDENGKRWTKVLFDVMTNKGTRYIRQVTVKLGMHFDFGTGRYAIDIPLDEMYKEIIRQYPSLALLRGGIIHSD